MKTTRRSALPRPTLGRIVLFFASALLGPSAEPPATPPAPPVRPVTSLTGRQAAREAYLAKLLEEEAKATVVLRAIGTPGGVPVAMCDLNGEPKLVMEGSELAGQVAEIDVANARVKVIRRDNSERILTLTDPRPVKFPEFSPQQVEGLIRMPNRRPPFDSSIPMELMRAWGDLNREAKEVILLSYLRSGVVIDITSSSGSSRAPLFGRLMAQRSQERMQAFLASLSPEQRDLFRESAQSLVRLDATPEKQAGLVDQNHQTGSKREQLLASLTPEQRKLYDAMHPAPQP